MKMPVNKLNLYYINQHYTGRATLLPWVAATICRSRQMSHIFMHIMRIILEASMPSKSLPDITSYTHARTCVRRESAWREYITQPVATLNKAIIEN